MKVMHNSNYYHPKELYTVNCQKCNKRATITVFYRSTKLCKTDIQLTPIKSGMDCSLWEEQGYQCIECPYLHE